MDGVTKLGKVPLSTQEEQQAENIRKMLLAMSKDVRVIIIKLADRLHNMRTLMFKKPQRRRDIALETLEIYAPLAHRLGIRPIKEELEDLAISFLDPVAYKEIEHRLSEQSTRRIEFLNDIKSHISERVRRDVTDAHIDGRKLLPLQLPRPHVARTKARHVRMRNPVGQSRPPRQRQQTAERKNLSHELPPFHPAGDCP